MRRFKKDDLLATSALVAVCLAVAPASAQEGEAAQGDKVESGAEEIIVTGSRTIANGDSAPSPVTVVSADQLMLGTPSTISDGLATIPQFRGSSRPASTPTTQTPVRAFANLRGLSTTEAPRTLVLLDGRRVNPSGANGQVDLNSLPNLLVKRVDIVTGGASAAYGSDAVAGVVNYILDKRFTGFKADMNLGISSRGDNESQKLGVAAGANLLDGRLHLVGSVEYFNSQGIRSKNNRDWLNTQCEPIQNPTYPADGRARFLFRCGVVGTDFARGGVITAGPLRGIQFGPGGTTAPYVYGQEMTAGGTMIGGDGEWLSRGNIASPIRTISGFGHAEFEVSPKFSVFGEVSYVRNEAKLDFIYPFFAGATAFTIFPDNPYLPDTIKTQMATANQASIRVGRVGLDWGQAEGGNSSDDARFALGFKSQIGDWILDGYADFGRTQFDQYTNRNLNRARTYEAADVVRHPTSGQIICRSTLTNPQNGCSPLNLFGEGSSSPAALDYILGTAFTTGWSEQIAGELSLRGSPFSTWAGAVQVGAGANYRRISGASSTDEVSKSPIAAAPGSRGTPANIIGVLGGWLAGNQVDQPRASYNVKEVFAEALIPLASDMALAHALDLNVAARYADYSTAGGATSWKIGLSYSPIEDIRLRFTRSRDVRAPNLMELFGPQKLALTTTLDPVTGQTVQIAGYSGGNAALKPEFGDTTTFGIVLAPQIIPGLSIAVDYYDIKLSGAISGLTLANTLQLCAGGSAVHCQFITRLPPPANTLVSVRSPALNLDQLRTSGVDIEANYSLPLDRIGKTLPGTLSFRLLASYLDRLTRTDTFGTVTDTAGLNGGERVATPSWQGSFSALYRSDPWTFFVQERYISSGKQQTLSNPPYTSGTGPNSLDINHVPTRWYTDVTVRYAVSKGVEIYGTVNNLFDQDPPQAPTRAGLPFIIFPTNGTLYDVVGRYFTAGVKLGF